MNNKNTRSKRQPLELRWSTVVILAILAASFFTWGFLSHRGRFFPYNWIKNVARGLDLVEEPDTRLEAIYGDETRMKELTALPYAVRSYDPQGDQLGVILHDETKVFQGLNFYSSADLPAAFLLNMDGELLYQWRHRGRAWQHATLLPSGEVMVIVKDQALHKLSPESEILWTFEGRPHHNLWTHDDGRIFVLTRKSERLPTLHEEHPILSDYVTILSANGDFLEEISILELFQNSSYAFLLPSVGYRAWSRPGEDPAKVALDILHTNHIEGFDGSQAHQFHGYKKGNVLLSMRHLDTIAIADLSKRKIVWAWGQSTLSLQHHPTVLDNGNILIFNNGTEESEVLELDPRTRNVVWFYGREPDFFSRTRGSSFRLPNGNTLITESDPGYVFEVTPEGEKVWIFANPRINEQDERTAIWRMHRFTLEQLPFLTETQPPP